MFISYLLNHSKKEIIKLVSGTTVKHIYPSQIITCQLPIVYNKPEQQKIASCLSSLDEVIAAHSQKLDLLKDHKKGLMQNLFPQMSESGFTGLKDNRMNDDEIKNKTKKILTSQNQKNQGSDNVPKVRFKEFEEMGSGWKKY
ncbi:MAG: restriction endonuclease subunit S [Saprospiraceae bacterium]|nr:restriction endonuclease subunit S [Saprospiraceae bacterium]